MLLRSDQSNSPVAGHGRNQSRSAWLLRPAVIAAASCAGAPPRPPPAGGTFGLPSRSLVVFAPLVPWISYIRIMPLWFDDMNAR